jgi:hypothetical protein
LENAAGNKTLPTAPAGLSITPLPSPFAAQGASRLAISGQTIAISGHAATSPSLHGHACAVEKANGVHFARDTLHGTRADAALPSNRQHALAGP